MTADLQPLAQKRRQLSALLAAATHELYRAVVVAHREGVSISRIHQLTGLSRVTVYRVVDEATKEKK